MNLETEHRGDPSWPGEDAARRLFADVRAACAGSEGLPGRLEAALRLTLETFAADPDVARLLTVDIYRDDLALAGLREWMGRFGDLLREAVAEDPRTVSSDLPFLSRFVIGGVHVEIGRRVLTQETADLLRFLPSLLAGALSFYFEPGEPIALAEAAIAAHGTQV